MLFQEEQLQPDSRPAGYPFIMPAVQFNPRMAHEVRRRNKRLCQHSKDAAQGAIFTLG